MSGISFGGIGMFVTVTGPGLGFAGLRWSADGHFGFCFVVEPWLASEFLTVVLDFGGRFIAVSLDFFFLSTMTKMIASVNKTKPPPTPRMIGVCVEVRERSAES